MTSQRRKEILLKYRQNNRERIRANAKKWYWKHKNDPRVIADKKRWNKEWNDRNRDRRNAWARDYRRKNRDRIIAQKKKWYVENPEKVREIRRKELIKVGARIAAYMRTRVRLAVLAQKTWKRGKTLELLGCSITELKEHLMAKFKPGMSWDNYGKWHIDHIIPLASFDLTKEEQQKKAFHFTNLQPLWAEENLKKGAKNEPILQLLGRTCNKPRS